MSDKLMKINFSELKDEKRHVERQVEGQPGETTLGHTTVMFKNTKDTEKIQEYSRKKERITKEIRMGWTSNFPFLNY